MKLKYILFAAVLLPFVNGASYAMQIQKGKLLSHKEWTTGEAKMRLKLMPAELNTKRHYDTTMIQNEVTAFSQIEHGANQYSPVQGKYLLWVANYSNTKQVYEYYTSICVETSPNHGQCGHIYDEIELEPNGMFFAPEQPQLDVFFDAPGVYHTYVMSSLSGSEDRMQTSNQASLSSGLLEITA